MPGLKSSAPIWRVAAEELQVNGHNMSNNLNSLKGGYIGDYIGDYYNGY